MNRLITNSPLKIGMGKFPADIKKCWFSPLGMPEFEAMSWWKTYDMARSFIFLGYFFDYERKAFRCELREVGLRKAIYIDYWVFFKSIKEGLYVPWENI